MVGLDLAVEVVPGDRAHRLVGQTEALQHHDVGPVVDAELDVRQHVGLVALAHQQRTALASRLQLEAAAVDQAGTEGDRIDAEAGPRQVEERQRREHVDVTRGSARSSSTARSATTGEPGTA